jgi:hypothetical protein
MTKKFAKRFLTRNADTLIKLRRDRITNAITRTGHLCWITLYHPTPWLFKKF